MNVTVPHSHLTGLSFQNDIILRNNLYAVEGHGEMKKLATELDEVLKDKK